MQYIYNYDLTSLRELWGHLDTRMFCRLESHFTPAIRKLENAVLKMYLVNAAVNGKQEKIQEFFTKMTPELQGHSEWKEWFGMTFSHMHSSNEFMTSRIQKIIICMLCDIAAFPFIKNPEDNPVYSIHFSRQWHDTMLVSLHNFLATIFQVSKRSTFVTLQSSNQFHQINDGFK